MNPTLPIRIFRADSMQHTPFSAENCLVFAQTGIAFVDEPPKADIIISRRESWLKPYGSYNKRFGIWTHEPRWDFRIEPVVSISGIRNPVHIMNAYTGKIYADTFYYFQRCELDFNERMRTFADKHQRAVMLATYRRPPTPVILDGRNVDLLQYRQKLAKCLLKRGFCDVYGRLWPVRIRTSGDSRKGAWKEVKRKILREYVVNIAFESTNIPYYVTEKLWDAIIGACLPVYHGAGSGIYECFPQQSFIEADGKSVELLADEITHMSTDEMQTRYAACLRTYIGLNARGRLREASHRACFNRTVTFLHSMLSDVGSQPPSTIE